jgi:hypothetical protein
MAVTPALTATERLSLAQQSVAILQAEVAAELANADVADNVGRSVASRPERAEAKRLLDGSLSHHGLGRRSSPGNFQHLKGSGKIASSGENPDSLTFRFQEALNSDTTAANGASGDVTMLASEPASGAAAPATVPQFSHVFFNSGSGHWESVPDPDEDYTSAKDAPRCLHQCSWLYSELLPGDLKVYCQRPCDLRQGHSSHHPCNCLETHVFGKFWVKGYKGTFAKPTRE